MNERKTRQIELAFLCVLSRVVPRDSDLTSWNAASLIFNNLPAFYVIPRSTDCTMNLCIGHGTFAPVSFFFFKPAFKKILNASNCIIFPKIPITYEHISLCTYLIEQLFRFAGTIVTIVSSLLKEKRVDSNYRACLKYSRYINSTDVMQRIIVFDGHR